MANDTDQFYLTEAHWLTALLYQITAPRTVQAALVMLFSVLVGVQLLRGEAVPDPVLLLLGAMVGTYFNLADPDSINLGIRRLTENSVNSAR